MQGFIFSKAHDLARYLEKKGEKLSRLKWEEAEFVYSLPWDFKEGRTIVYGETHILLAPNGCWFGWRQGKGYVVVPRRPAFKWNIPRPSTYSQKEDFSYMRDPSKLLEMTGMIALLMARGRSHENIARGMGVSRDFVVRFINYPDRRVGVRNGTYLALKAYYERVGARLDADAV